MITKNVIFQRNIVVDTFEARSPSREKGLLTSSCPPVSPRLSARLSLDVFSRNLLLGTSMKIRLVSPDVAKIKQKFRALYVGTRTFFSCRRH